MSVKAAIELLDMISALPEVGFSVVAAPVLEAIESMERIEEENKGRTLVAKSNLKIAMNDVKKRIRAQWSDDEIAQAFQTVARLKSQGRETVAQYHLKNRKKRY